MGSKAREGGLVYVCMYVCTLSLASFSSAKLISI